MHPMKRAFLIVLFGLGTVGGFAHGFASLGRCANRHHGERRMEFEDHVADVCLRAAERRGPHHPPAWPGGAPAAPPPFPPPGE
jgi:hypothetical protein